MHNTHPRSQMLRQTACCEATTRLLKNGRRMEGTQQGQGQLKNQLLLPLMLLSHNRRLGGNNTQRQRQRRMAALQRTFHLATRLSSRWDFSHDCDFAWTLHHGPKNVLFSIFYGIPPIWLLYTVGKIGKFSDMKKYCSPHWESNPGSLSYYVVN